MNRQRRFRKKLILYCFIAFIQTNFCLQLNTTCYINYIVMVINIEIKEYTRHLSKNKKKMMKKSDNL